MHSELKVFSDQAPEVLEQHHSDKAAMARVLASAGVRYEQWQANQPLSESPQQDEVIQAYQADIDRLIADEGYQTVDVVSMVPDHPDKATFRQKFLEEHKMAGVLVYLMLSPEIHMQNLRILLHLKIYHNYLSQ